MKDISFRKFSFWILALVTGWQFRVVTFFLAGCLLYLVRYSVPYSSAVAKAIALVLLVSSVIVPEQWDTPTLNLILCPALAYLTVVMGVSQLPTSYLSERSDYSYGIYLYAYPLQQAVYKWGLGKQSWEINALISLVLAFLFAALSWRLIEKPILRRRRKLVNAA